MNKGKPVDVAGINEGERLNNRAFYDRHKDLLESLPSDPEEQMRILTNVLLQESYKFADMSDDEVYEFIMGDFWDLYFYEEYAFGHVVDAYEHLREGNVTCLPELLDVSIRESATGIHESLKVMSKIFPLKTEEDVVNLFRQHTIQFSYLNNYLLKMKFQKGEKHE